MQNANDPLQYSKHILNHMNKVFTIHVHRLEVMLLDKLVLAIKYQTRAKSYLPMKPDPHRLRYYGLSGAGLNAIPYLFSLVNNGSGNISGILQVKKYLS